MIAYLIKMVLCSALMLTAYFLFLEKEKMYRFNRFYLLLSLVFCFAVPFITMEVRTEVQIPEPVSEVRYVPAGIPVTVASVSKPVMHTNEKDIVVPALLMAYCLITAGFLFRFAKNIRLILSGIAASEIIPFRGAKLVLIQEEIVSHTFFNYIFINETQYHNRLIERELYTHELSHAAQKHSIDILFIELLYSIFWFNPVFILYKKAIEMNHEFLADEAVISSCNDVKNYQRLLLSKISLGSNIQLTNSFNYSITKKRLTMMTKSVNSKNVLIRQLMLTPVLVLAIFLFSTKVEAQDKSDAPKPEMKEVVIEQSEGKLTEIPVDQSKLTEKRIPAGKMTEQPINRAIPFSVAEVDKDWVTKSQQLKEERLSVTDLRTEKFKEYSKNTAAINDLIYAKVDGVQQAVTDTETFLKKMANIILAANGKVKIVGDVEQPGTYSPAADSDIGSLIHAARLKDINPKHIEITITKKDDQLTEKAVSEKRGSVDFGVSLSPTSRITSRNGVSISDIRVSLLISSSTTKEQLKDYQSMLGRRGFELNIERADYDSNKRLKYIKMTVICNDDPKNSTGSIAQELDGSNAVGFSYDKNQVQPFTMLP